MIEEHHSIHPIRHADNMQTTKDKQTNSNTQDIHNDCCLLYQDGETPLYIACAEGDGFIGPVEMLVKKGANVNVKAAVGVAVFFPYIGCYYCSNI